MPFQILRVKLEIKYLEIHLHIDRWFDAGCLV